MFGVYKIPQLLLVFFGLAFVLNAQNTQSRILQAETEQDKTILAILGASLEDIHSRFGAPDSVFSSRASEAWMDTVVYYYELDHFYFFWWDDRVWQLRFDKRYTGDFFGLRMGMTRTTVEVLLGSPFRADDLSLSYLLNYEAYSRELRLEFDKDGLSDLYCYRSDF